MEVSLDLQKRYTYADYLTSAFDDIGCELIDGFVHLMAAPLRIHARVSLDISFWIGTFLKDKKRKCQIFHAPFDVRLPVNGSKEDGKIYDVVQPDICVVCDMSKLDYRGCIGAPDLIVEVLSPATTKRDWIKKFNLYQKAGVREYWIVDPKWKTINVFLMQSDGKYDEGTVYECNQKAPVFIFEGLEIDLNDLFGE